MPLLPGAGPGTTEVQITASTPTPADARIDVTVHDQQSETKQRISTPTQHTGDHSRSDHNQHDPSSGSGSTPQDKTQQPKKPDPTNDAPPAAGSTQWLTLPTWEAEFLPGTWTTLTVSDSARLTRDHRNYTFTESIFIGKMLLRAEADHKHLINCEAIKGKSRTYPLRLRHTQTQPEPTLEPEPTEQELEKFSHFISTMASEEGGDLNGLLRDTTIAEHGVLGHQDGQLTGHMPTIMTAIVEPS